MIVQPTRDQLRALALREDANAHQPDNHTPDLCGDPECVATCVVDGVEWPCETAWLLDQLDAAEQRIRDLTQEVRDERGAARDQMEQVRIRDARIQAVRDVLDDLEQTDPDQIGWDAAGLLPALRRALESVPPPGQ